MDLHKHSHFSNLTSIILQVEHPINPIHQRKSNYNIFRLIKFIQGWKKVPTIFQLVIIKKTILAKP